MNSPISLLTARYKPSMSMKIFPSCEVKCGPTEVQTATFVFKTFKRSLTLSMFAKIDIESVTVAACCMRASHWDRHKLRTKEMKIKELTAWLGRAISSASSLSRLV